MDGAGGCTSGHNVIEIRIRLWKQFVYKFLNRHSAPGALANNQLD